MERLPKRRLNRAGSFIAGQASSSLNFRVKGISSVKKEQDNVFYVTGTAEGFSSYNVPFSIDHFSETVRYSGGNIDDIKNDLSSIGHKFIHFLWL
jgi:hypothetical protein